VACQAQLVNVIAPIRTETGGRAWRQSIFHPFALTARHARGTVLRTEPVTPRHETARYGDVPSLSTAAVYDEENGALSIFAVNRAETPLSVELDLRAFPRFSATEHIILDGAPRRLETAGRVTVQLAGASWNLIRSS
jgi:alpha-N-arabinofuranosidase